jgi:hypothetical protein
MKGFVLTYRFVFLICLILVLPFTMDGQRDSMVQITKNFSFEDGVYLSHQDFVRNQPTYTWQEVNGNMHTNPQDFLTKVQYLRHEESGKELTGDIWGLCLGGIPYIRLERKEEEELITFAGLRVRGKICYFTFEEEQVRKIKMSAYNPRNGRPFRTGVVERSEVVQEERMMQFETGLIRAFTVDYFKEWIQDDPGLLQSVDDLSQEEARKKLFKCLLIYDDRNTVMVPFREKE